MKTLTPATVADLSSALDRYVETGNGRDLHQSVVRAIASEALNAMAENASEIGLDYEPAQQQEPVAWAKQTEKRLRFTTMPMDYEDGWRPLVFGDIPPPARKPWVGLTDEEVNEIVGAFDYRYDVARAIEAKLREKNA